MTTFVLAVFVVGIVSIGVLAWLLLFAENAGALQRREPEFPKWVNDANDRLRGRGMW